jgi:hypothetical protein
MGQRYAAYDDQGNITGFYDSVDSPVPDGIVAVAITFDQFLTFIDNPGWTYVNGVWLPPPPPPLTAQQLDPLDHTFGDDLWQSSIA